MSTDRACWASPLELGALEEATEYSSLVAHPRWVELVGLKFEHGTAWIGVNIDTDELVLCTDRPDDDVAFILPDDGFWKPMIGMKVLWSWTMTSNTGSNDALQLWFSHPDRDDQVVQLLGMASEVNRYRLVRQGDPHERSSPATGGPDGDEDPPTG